MMHHQVLLLLLKVERDWMEQRMLLLHVLLMLVVGGMYTVHTNKLSRNRGGTIHGDAVIN